jgi:hypothetical protein
MNPGPVSMSCTLPTLQTIRSSFKSTTYLIEYFELGLNRWTDDLLYKIEESQIDPSFVVTHRIDLEQGADMNKTFRDKEDGCVKVILRP